MLISENEFLDAVVAKIKKLRKERKISQLDLALILGHKSPNYVAKIETRRHGVNYNLHHIYTIARAFELDFTELLPSIEECEEFVINHKKHTNHTIS